MSGTMTHVYSCDRKRVSSPRVPGLHLTHSGLLLAWQVPPGDAVDQ